MLRKEPMNTNEFYHAICGILKEKVVKDYTTKKETEYWEGEENAQ